MSDKVILNSSDYQALRDRLPFGYIKRVQSILNERNPKDKTIDPSTITKVLKGEFLNEEVLLALIQVAEQEERKWNSMRKAMRGKMAVSKLKFHLESIAS